MKFTTTLLCFATVMMMTLVMMPTYVACHSYGGIKINGINLGKTSCKCRQTYRKCDMKKSGDIYQCVTDNLVQKITKVFLTLLKQTEGFLTPVDTARALSILQTSFYNVLSIYHDDFDAVHLECVDLKKFKRCPNGNELKVALLLAAKKVGQFLFNKRPQELNTYLQSITVLLNGCSPIIHPHSGSTSGSVTTIVDEVDKCIRARYVNDGANQLGNMNYSNTAGVPYSDYTNYSPVNRPQPVIGKTDCGDLVDINHWQQLKVPLDGGGSEIRDFLSPHYGLVKPFALKNAYEVFPPPPPSLTSNDPTVVQKQKDEAAEVLTISATLNDYKKVVAEYWADGPDSTLPPGHWTDLALKMAEKKHLSLVETILLLFLQSNAQFDAGISTWAAKRYYDFARPITQLQCLYASQQVTAWRGPYQGVGLIDGSDWKPYQNRFFVTPPFAEYVSGHSAFSTASAEVMKLFFNSDSMSGLSFTVKAGDSLFEPKILPGNPGYVAGETDVPNTGPTSKGYVPAADVVLSWNTFTEAADESGISRLYGGIHFKSGNDEGKIIGRKVGKIVWEKFLDLINK